MSGCTLELSRNSPLRTTLVDKTTGQARYKIDTPRKVARSVTRIGKFDPPSAQPPLHPDEDADPDPGDDIANRGKKEGKKYRKETIRDGTETEFPEIGDEMARIYWKWFSPHRIVFRGRIITRNQFMPKAGKMKVNYTFTGPDGVQYRWLLGTMGLHYPKLVTTDEQTVVAEFHRAHNIRKKQKARLEIHPAGMDVLDHIVLTFVFVEDRRRQREAWATSDITGVI